MAKISLTDLQNESQKKYGDLIVDDVPGGEVLLLNGLRLPNDKKAELDRLQREATELARRLESDDDSLSDEERRDATEHPMFGRILRLVCKDEDQEKRLFDFIGEDHGLLLTIWNAYTDVSQPGEAPPSQS
jgi:hypothetical protein